MSDGTEVKTYARAQARIIDTYYDASGDLRLSRGSLCEGDTDGRKAHVYLNGVHVDYVVYVKRDSDGTGVILRFTPNDDRLVYEAVTGRVEVLLDVRGAPVPFIDGAGTLTEPTTPSTL